MNGLMIGFGSIARAVCTLKLPLSSIIIIDKLDLKIFVDNFFSDKKIVSKNSIDVQFINMKITKQTLAVVKKIIMDNNINIVIDCSYNIDTLDLISSLPPKISFINTSVEDWEEDDIATIRTLKNRQDKIKDWYNNGEVHLHQPADSQTRYNNRANQDFTEQTIFTEDLLPDQSNETHIFSEVVGKPNNILLDCGMNPGLISLWAYDCCQKMEFDAENITQCIVSEVDTQRAIVPRKEGEFICTWSPDGFMEEVHSPIEGHSLGKYFVNNRTTGYKTVSKSLRPNGEIFYGYTVRHAETITLHKLFPNATLMYIYKCPDEAVSSLFEYQEPKPLKSKRLLFTNDIIDGKDELGVLMATDDKLVWYGSHLSNDMVKNYPLAKYINATSYQVACGLWIGINTLAYYKNSNIFRLMTPEDIIQCPIFDDLLRTVNQYLQIEMVEFDKTDNVDKIIKNKSFEQHFKK